MVPVASLSIALRLASAGGLALAMLATTVNASEMLAGPYPAAVERVVDGDTLDVRVAIWLHQNLGVLVRIRGIDAPELRGRCASERERAGAAMLALKQLVSKGAVVLTDIEGDKYFGRVVADVTSQAGEDLGAALVAGGHARLYDGGARQPWCEPGATGSVAGASALAVLSAPD